jgi:putative ABC transport system permease protein
MSIVKIAWRNVERQKRRSNLLVGAIAFGVIVILMINSLTTGLINNAQSNFTSLLGGHIYISGEEVLDSGRVVSRTDDTYVLDQVLPYVEDQVSGIFKRSIARGEFIFGSKSTRISFSAVHWDSEPGLLETVEIISGSSESLSDPAAILLPEDAAEKLGVQAGESILFRFDTVTGQKNVAEFTVGAIIKDTGSFGISSSYGDIMYFNPLLGLEVDEYQSLNLELYDINAMEQVASILESEIEKIAPLYIDDDEEESEDPGRAMMFSGTSSTDERWDGTRFAVSTLNDFMDMIIQMIAILNWISIGLFLVLLTITMVGLLNTFRMILIERTREIGTMRAVGMLRKNIKGIFLLEALFLALKGAVIGIAVALVGSWGVSLINLGDDNPLLIFLQNGHFSMPFLPLKTIGIVVLLSLITLLAAWLPARKAAKLQPADALRTTN